jgi:hypothetical protein
MCEGPFTRKRRDLKQEEVEDHRLGAICVVGWREEHWMDNQMFGMLAGRVVMSRWDMAVDIDKRRVRNYVG